MKLHPLFDSHQLNNRGKTLTVRIAEEFTDILENLEQWCLEGRDLDIVRTKLQEAKFYAVRAMALKEEHQE